MIARAVPLLHETDSRRAERYYHERLGFRVLFVTRGDAADPCYLGVARDGAELHLSSHAGDAAPGGVAVLVVDDVDALYGEFAAKGATLRLPPTDQTWGNRDLYVEDPDGNVLRFVQPGAAAR